jgi:hypothetical protein
MKNETSSVVFHLPDSRRFRCLSVFFSFHNLLICESPKARDGRGTNPRLYQECRGIMRCAPNPHLQNKVGGGDFVDQYG